MNTPNQLRSKMNRLGEAVGFLFAMVFSLFILYLFFYLGIYRGGRALSAYLAQAFSSAEFRKEAFDILKVLFGILGASLGAILAAYVRRYFAFRTLKEKLVILEELRKQVLKACESKEATLALDGETVKKIFTESDYGRLVKYADAKSTIEVFRAASAIQYISQLASKAIEDAKTANIPKFVIEQLEQVNPIQISEKLELFGSPTGPAEEAAEKTLT